MIERRAVHRYDLSFEIDVHVPALGLDSSYPGRTRDICTRGVNFIVSRPLALQIQVHCTIVLPAQLATEDAVIRCEGNVLRVTGCQETGFEIAVAIDRYEISALHRNKIVGHPAQTGRAT